MCIIFLYTLPSYKSQVKWIVSYRGMVRSGGQPGFTQLLFQRVSRVGKVWFPGEGQSERQPGPDRTSCLRMLD
ncbi:hypothetical protein HanHA300_Chr17g0653741 [Helianthus annuus]|nr:hypothetical protein HanHA300_Chr17g0653741 [Helianthus annuus]KAJ0447476.1 hypothetical protein HanHA89_Chr17g0705831 [Helianthus annuus]KAJ0632358.1 hypothetical protein HanLR1_Chr17g0664251 [Helianthus annuus]